MVLLSYVTPISLCNITEKQRVIALDISEAFNKLRLSALINHSLRTEMYHNFAFELGATFAIINDHMIILIKFIQSMPVFFKVLYCPYAMSPLH